MSLLFRTAALAAALVAAGCNAYDPDLGSQPFRCSDADPRCPEGYSCVVYGPGTELCEAGGGEPGTDGGGDFACNDDDTEPNDSPSAAFATPIPNQADTFGLVEIAVCPAGDVDVFRLGVDVSGRNLRADVTFDSAQGDLVLEILNDNETVIRTGAPVQGDAGLLRAEVPNLPPGTYFVQVSGESQVENNYSIDVELTGP